MDIFEKDIFEKSGGLHAVAVQMVQRSTAAGRDQNARSTKYCPNNPHCSHRLSSYFRLALDRPLAHRRPHYVRQPKPFSAICSDIALSSLWTPIMVSHCPPVSLRTLTSLVYLLDRTAQIYGVLPLPTLQDTQLIGPLTMMSAQPNQRLQVTPSQAPNSLSNSLLSEHLLGHTLVYHLHLLVFVAWQPNIPGRQHLLGTDSFHI